MSGGIGSFAAAERVARRHGIGEMVLLFADTLVEDPDLYRFLGEAVEYLGVPLTRVADGRTPFQVFADVRYIGNSRIAPCSKWLKQAPCRGWLERHCDPADTILYVGLDAEELRREPGVVKGWSPWRVEFPLVEKPCLTKQQMLDECRDVHGIEPPLLYELGYSHNNCGGVCVRAGRKQWLRTLTLFPERFAEAERREAELRAELGDYSILREQRNGIRYPLPLSELRRRAEVSTTPPAELSPHHRPDPPARGADPATRPTRSSHALQSRHDRASGPANASQSRMNAPL